MELMQEIRFNYARVQLLEPKLIRLEIFGKVTIGKKEAKEINDAIAMLSRGKESLVLMVADEITTFNKEALDFSASDEGLRYTIGDALVVKSISQRVTANFYLKINKPKKPSKVFNSEKDAVNWLFALENSFVPA